MISFLAQVQVEPGWVTALSALLMGMATLILIGRGLSVIRGTVLMFPWAWLLISTTLFCLTEVVAGLSVAMDQNWTMGPWRFIAAMSLFCPQLSQMGTHKPQQYLWQVVVAAFWLALCGPVLRAWWVNSFEFIEPGWLLGTLLVFLVVVGLLNNGLTRFAPSAICLAAAQIMGSCPYLPGMNNQPSAAGGMIAITGLLVGTLLVSVGWPRRMTAHCPEDDAWLDFRDWFGSWWAFRVLRRMNQAALKFDWGLWLTWHGFERVEIVGSDPDFRDDIKQGLFASLRKLFSHFVDDAWLDSRLPRPKQPKKGLEELKP